MASTYEPRISYEIIVWATEVEAQAEAAGASPEDLADLAAYHQDMMLGFDAPEGK